MNGSGRKQMNAYGILRRSLGCWQGLEWKAMRFITFFFLNLYLEHSFAPHSTPTIPITISFILPLSSKHTL